MGSASKPAAPERAGGHRRIAWWTLAVGLAVGLVGCGTPAAHRSAPPTVARGCRTAAHFRMVTCDATRFAVGHGLRFRVPDDWVVLDRDRIGPDGHRDWTVGMPRPLCGQSPKVRVSLGGTYAEARRTALADARRLSRFHLLERREATVPGAAHATLLRYTARLSPCHLAKVTVRTSVVTVEDGHGRTATLGFLAPTGAARSADRALAAARKSLTLQP